MSAYRDVVRQALKHWAETSSETLPLGRSRVCERKFDNSPTTTPQHVHHFAPQPFRTAPITPRNLLIHRS